MEKIIFDDYLKNIRTWGEPVIHVKITEDDMAIRLWENGILKREKIKER